MAWLLSPKAGLNDRHLSRLRLKVDGDLKCDREMINLQTRTSKQEVAMTDKRTHYNLRNYREYITGEAYYEDQDWQ